MMDWLSEHWLSLACVAVYLGILVRHAVVAYRHVNSLEDYIVAGRSLGGWVIAFSFYATFMSTNTFIGAAGKSWKYGLVWCASGVVFVGLCGVSWLVVAPRFVPLTRSYQSLTVADFLGHRYCSPLVRRCAAVIVVLASVIYLVAIFKGASIALETALSIPYFWSVILVFAVVTSYTLVGGFESVVLTDALQGLLMLLGAVGLLTALVIAGGGPSPIIETVRQQDPLLVSWPGPTSLWTVFGISLAVGIKFLVEPRQLSRFYGLRDSNAARLAACVAPVIVLITYFCLLPLGALAHAVIPQGAIESTDHVVPYLLERTQLFGPLMSSLFLVVLLSAAMSSIDSVLLVTASSIEHDLISPNAGDLQAVNRTRCWVVAVSAATTIAAVNPRVDDIVTVTSLSGSLYGACFLGPLVLGLYWRRPDARAAFCSMACGALTVGGWYVARKLEHVSMLEIYPGLLVGLGVYCGIGCCIRQRTAT